MVCGVGVAPLFRCFAMGLGGVVVLGGRRDGIPVRGLFSFGDGSWGVASSWIWQAIKMGNIKTRLAVGRVVLF